MLFLARSRLNGRKPARRKRSARFSYVLEVLCPQLFTAPGPAVFKTMPKISRVFWKVIAEQRIYDDLIHASHYPPGMSRSISKRYEFMGRMRLQAFERQCRVVENWKRGAKWVFGGVANYRPFSSDASEEFFRVPCSDVDAAVPYHDV